MLNYHLMLQQFPPKLQLVIVVRCYFDYYLLVFDSNLIELFVVGNAECKDSLQIKSNKLPTYKYRSTLNDLVRSYQILS